MALTAVDRLLLKRCLKHEPGAWREFVDRFLGLIFGLLRGVVLLGVFVILGQLLRLDGEHWWTRSLLIPYGESVANGLRTLVGEQRVRHAGGVSDRSLMASIVVAA